MMNPSGLSLLFCLTFLTILSTADTLGNETDRLSLLAIKDRITHYPPEGVLRAWNDSIEICKWEGVTCGNRHRRVIILNLMSQRLTGTISPSIGNLSFLTTINLGNNSFQGEIPEEIGRLTRLRAIYLGNNSLSGRISANMTHCTNLVNLTLLNNMLVGEVPMAFGSFAKLAKLSISGNHLTGGVPTSLGNLSSLKYLHLGNNHLEGSIPNSLGQLKNIWFLALSQNMLSGLVPPSIYNISSLEIFSLSINKLEGSLPVDIGLNLPNLRELYFGGNYFVGTIPVSLFVNSSNLEKFYFSDSNFTGNIPVEVGHLKVLRALNLANNNLGSGGKEGDLDFITSLNNCSDLELLDVSINQLGGELPASVVNLSTKLSKLHLGENQITGGIPSDIGNLFNLIIFSASQNFFIGTIPRGIGMLHKLQHLFISHNRLSGRIPYSVGNISSLYFLELSYNNFVGAIPTSFVKCQSLSILYLAHNQLTGGVPKEILGLSIQITYIRLSQNNLNGSLSLGAGNLQNLRGIDVSENNISGEIPSTLGNCLGLESLRLQGNFFQGIIPSTFSNLKGIQDINLSRNNLFGKIPQDLEILPVLESLDLSFNNFQGEIPTKGIFQNVSAFSVVGNEKLCGGVTELGRPKCHTLQSKNKGKTLALKATLSVLLPLLIITSLLLAFCLRKAPTSKSFTGKIANLQQVSYNELRNATNGFSSSNLIGRGRYGSVYKGILKEDEGIIAVKVLNLVERGSSKSFLTECEVLSKVRHRNLLKVLTVCSSTDFEGNAFKALIFKFMSNGSVEDWLHSSSNDEHPLRNLNFHQRLNITIDIAFALDYLHNQCEEPIVHCDLKPSNILLDNDMVAYVGDFGLAKLLPKNSSSCSTSEASSVGIRGTIGYIPPEYGMGADVSIYGDVYSFGVLLLEMSTGKRATDPILTDLNLHSYCKVNLPEQVMDIVDPQLLYQEVPEESTSNGIQEQSCRINPTHECLVSIMEIGIACSSEAITERINMKDALLKLQKIKETVVGMGNQTN